MKVWLYYRLSRDEDEELNSLNNQRKIIYNFAVSNGHQVVGESFDDNVSGMHFNREGIDKIYEVVEAGKIEAIIVKDLSRFGRNYIEVGTYIEIFFPKHIEKGLILCYGGVERALHRNNVFRLILLIVGKDH